MMAISYRNDALVSAKDLAALFEKSGIRRPTKDLERLQCMIDHANVIVTAWDDVPQCGPAKLLGIARTHGFRLVLLPFGSRSRSRLPAPRHWA